MRKRIFIFSLFLILLFLISACGEEENKQNGVPPIYRGMEITESIDELSSTNRLLSGEIDPNLQNDVENAFGVITSEQIEYYATLNQDIFINVTLYNPDNYVILSFTLNGVFYQSYQFQDGSDSETLILKVNTGDVSGVKAYTIDAIKYIDGTEIKDVIFEGNRTVQVGIEHTILPEASVKNEIIGSTSITFQVHVNDFADLININEGQLKAFLSYGEQIISEQNLVLGTNTITFNQLIPGKDYQYTIAAAYDKVDGQGIQVIVLYYNEVITNTLAELTVTNIGQTFVMFDIIFNDEQAVGAIEKIELFNEQGLLKTLETIDNLLFSELFTNNNYFIHFTYSYDLNDGIGKQHQTEVIEFTTLAKASPELYITDVVSTQESIHFGLTSLDEDQVGEIKKVELYKGVTLVESFIDLNSRLFEGLLSNNEYSIKITYNYDLQDGAGEQELVLEHNVTTLAKATPELELLQDLTTQTSFTVSGQIVDTDNILITYELLTFTNNEWVTLEILDPQSFSFDFDNLLSNYSYSLKTILSYDLNDGQNIQVITTTYEFTTLEKVVPEISLNNVIVDPYQIKFNYEVTNPDNTGTFDSVELKLDGETLQIFVLDGTSNIIFDQLFSNTEYYLIFPYSYDLNDGFGIIEDHEEYIFKTEQLVVPNLTLLNVTSGASYIEFDLDIIDIDLTGEIFAIEVFNGVNLVKSLSSFDVYKVDGLLPDTNYELKISYKYNLNDQEGDQFVTKSHFVFTAPYLKVISTEVINTERLTEGDTIVLEISVDNPSKVDIKRVLINGTYFVVADTTTHNFIRVSMVLDESYTGGVTEFVVEKIEAEKNTQLRTYDIIGNNVGSAFIYGDIFVENIEIVDQLGNPLEYVMRGEIYYVKITFDNPTEYQIDSITLSYLGTVYPARFMPSSDSQTVIIEQTSNMVNTVVSFAISEFAYSDDQGSKTKSVSGYSAFIIGVIDSKYQYIDDVDGLINMRDGYAYKLANDIDMTDIDWTPLNLNFISLDGNGYAITNLRAVKTVYDTSIYYGLFGQLNYSVVKNLSIQNTLYVITMNNSSTSNGYQSNVGLIAGYSYMSSFINVSVNGEIEIINETGGEDYVGGIVGHSQQIKVTSGYANVILSARTNVGGIVGYGGWDLSIDKSFATGKLFGENRIGGLVAYTHNSKVTNSYSNVEINGRYEIGGLLGSAYSTYLANSYFSGKINSEYEWNPGSGLIGNGHNNTINNSFSIGLNQNGQPLSAIQNNWQTTTSNVYSLVVEELAIQATQEEILEIMSGLWHPSIWSFVGQAPAIKWTPYVRISNILVGETFVNFDISTTDYDNIGEITSVDIYHGDELIGSVSSLFTVRFELLRYNTDYRIEVTYSYNYGDEFGLQEIKVQFRFRTLAVTGTPELYYEQVQVSHQDVSFGYQLVDTLGIGTIESFELFDEFNQLVGSLTVNDQLLFTDLVSNKSYYIRATVSYDLSDGYGIQYVAFDKVFKTNPYVEFNTTSILNTGAIITGDTLVIQISIDNPDYVDFKFAMINGVKYEVSSSNNNRIRIDVMIDDSLPIGDNIFMIESLEAEFNNLRYTYFLDETHQITTFINGDLYVEEVVIMSAQGEPIDYVLQGQSYQIWVYLYNPTLFSIDSIILLQDWQQTELNASQFIVEENYTLIKITRIAQGSNILRVGIQSITYSNDLILTKTRQISGYEKSLPILQNDEIIIIETPDQLQNMTGGYHYQLANDIDLLNFNWQPIENFYGIFDGNNYSISNLTLITTYDDQEVFVGLFERTNGAMIRNVTLDYVNFIITTRSSSTNHYGVYAGALVGHAERSTFENIIIIGEIDINQTNNGSTYVGLLAGSVYSSEFDRIYVEGAVTAKNHIGGMVGRLNDSMVSNAYANITLDGTADQIGGLIGQSYHNDIKDSYTKGVILNQNYWGRGGFVGYAGYTFFENVFSMVTNETMAYMDPLQSYHDSKFANAYSLAFSNSFTQRSYPVIMENIALLWDLSIWDLSSSEPRLKRIPIININTIVPLEYSTTFGVQVNDLDEVGEISAIELLRNGEIIQSLSDVSLRSFEGLRYSTNYVIRVTYTYNYQDIVGEKVVIIEKVFRTLDKENVPQVYIEDMNAGQENATFTVNIIDAQNVGYLKSIELYDKNHQYIETLTGDILSFSGLLSNTIYYIKAIYGYDFNDGFGESEIEAYTQLTTQAKETPWVSSMNLSSGVDYINYTIQVNDTDNVGNVAKIELYHNGVLVNTNDGSLQNSFTGLYSSQWWNYEIRLTFAYDLNDGFGEQTIVHGQSYYTNSKQAPSVTFDTLEIYEDRVVFEPSLNDPHETGWLTKVELYEGTQLIYTTTETFIGTVENLKSNTIYRLRISYSYNLNDLTGNKTGVYNYEFKTAPSFELLTTTILNNEAVMMNDILILELSVDNPSNIIFTEAVVNGRTYPVASQSIGRLRIDILIDEIIGAGDTILTVEKLKGQFDNINYTYNITANHMATQFINGDIYIESSELVDENGDPIEYGYLNETYYLKVKFYNPTHYDIERIDIGAYYTHYFTSDSFVLSVDKTTLMVQIPFNNQYMTQISIQQFAYKNELIDTRYRQVNAFTEGVTVLTQPQIIEVYTIDDLRNMTQKAYYKLMNDIDLTGVSWQPYQFRGVFDGNGHVISNLSIIRTYDDTSIYTGLFTHISNGVVKDLSVVQAQIYVTLRTQTTNYYEIHSGILAGYISNNSKIHNVMVSGEVVAVHRTNGQTYTGLLAGRVETSKLSQIFTTGHVESRNYVGGITGDLQNSQLLNSYSNATFNATQDYAGGISGRIGHSTLYAVYASGTSTNMVREWGISGISPYVYDSKLDYVFDYTKNYQGNTLPTHYQFWNNIINHTYSERTSNEFQTALLSDILVVMAAEWNLDIWSFGGTLPVLKRIPLVSVINVTTGEYDLQFDLQIIDYDQVGELVEISLYRQDVLVASLDDLSIRVFNDLRYSTEYIIKATYIYNYQDGQGDVYLVTQKVVRTLDKENVPVIEITNIVADQTSVVFDYSVTDVLAIGQLDSIVLYDQNNVLVDTLIDASNQFINLKSNNYYTIEIRYTYDFSDGFGVNTLVYRYEFLTEAKQVPIVTPYVFRYDSDSVTVKYTLNDPDQVGSLAGLEIYLDDILVESLIDLSVHHFDNLLSNHQYTIKYIFEYDLNDGLGVRTLTANTTVHTTNKLLPEPYLDNLVITTTSINFNPSLFDVDQIGSVVSIDLIKDGVVVESILASDTVAIQNLLSYQVYTIRIHYQYDTNENLGFVEDYTDFEMITHPIVEITQMTQLNTQEITMGDILVLQLNINNPENITFSEVVINGVTYGVDNQTDTTLRIDIVVDDEFMGGATTLVLEQLIGQKDTYDFIFHQDGTITLNTFINGEILINSITAVDATDMQIEYLTSYETYYAKVEFTNPTQYDIHSITISNQSTTREYTGLELVMNSDKTVLYVTLSASEYYEWRYYEHLNVTKFTYSNDRIDNRSRAVGGISTSFTLVIDKTPIMISTAEQLQNIQKGYVYELANDIDLSGIDWTPIQGFNGVLNGNSYTISNLSMVKTFEDESIYLGLFSQLNGSHVKNLTLDQFTIVATLRTYIEGNYEIRAGTLAGILGQYNTIKDINIISTISINNMTNGENSLGGLAGRIVSSNRIENIQVTGNYSSTNNNSYIGGLIGDISWWSNSNHINQVNINVKVKGMNNVGGLIGGVYYVSNLLVDNITVNGNIEGINYVGGVVGRSHSYNSITKYTNITNYADVIGVDLVGGLFGNLEYANVSNVTSFGSVTGRYNVGGLFGNIGYTNISNATSFGFVTGTNSVGGLIGSMSQSTLDKGYSNAYIRSSNGYHVGGLIGIVYHSTISNSYSNTSIDSNSSGQGGLIGYAYDTKIIHSYANATFIQDHYSIAGLISQIEIDVILEHVYATSVDMNGNDIRVIWTSHYQNDLSTAYTLVQGNGQLKTLSEILAIINTQYSHDTWDFTTTDTLGNPTLKS